MTARLDEDLMLGRVLEHMCDRNDHETVLHVLQVLGKAHRAGYLTINELIMCLVYCGNRFAEQGNCDFFREYVRFLPDINKIQDTTRSFTPLCKSYYFAHKHAATTLDTLQTDCMLLDTDTLLEVFIRFIAKNKIYAHWQLTPLLNKMKERKEIIDNDGFKQLCEGYLPPIQMRTGGL